MEDFVKALWATKMGAYHVLISIQEYTENMELLVYPLNLACSLNSAEWKSFLSHSDIYI